MTCLCRHRGRLRYSSNPFATWHSEVGGQYHILAALLPGKAWYPFSGDGWYKKLTPMGIPSSDRPAHSMSLYRLNYPDCLASNCTGNKLSHTEVTAKHIYKYHACFHINHLSMSKENNANCRNKEAPVPISAFYVGGLSLNKKIKDNILIHFKVFMKAVLKNYTQKSKKKSLKKLSQKLHKCLMSYVCTGNGVLICIFQQAVFSVKSIFDSMNNTHLKYSD